MFDSPFELCPVCRQYVLLDQTQRQCASEHHCSDAARCPLRSCFTGIEFGAGRIAPAAGPPKRRRAAPRS